MITEEFTIPTRGDHLFGKSWLPENNGDPKAIICLIHGLSEYSGRYEEFARFFTDRDIGVFAIDLIGHGHSPGKRGHNSDYEFFLDDVESLLKIARREFNDTVLFLFGQSMGGNIVANYITRRNTSEVTGAILSAAWLRLAFDPPAWKLKLAAFVRKFYPGYSESSSIDPEHLTKDEAIRKSYDEDSLVHRKITAGLYHAVTTNGEKSITDASKVTVPVLVFHGDSDKITSLEASQEFASKAGDLAQFKAYENVRHEPHNDLERSEVLEDVNQWILKNTN